MNTEELYAKIESFKNNRKENPVVYSEDNIIVLKLYNIKRKKVYYQDGERNTLDEVIQRSDFFESVILDLNSLESVENFISLESFTLKKDLKNFVELQDCKNEHLSFTDKIPTIYNVHNVEQINEDKFENYLKHLNLVKKIKFKTSKIVRDKFNRKESDVITTSALFANVGYIVKGFEGKYISLSKGDRTFIKNFLDEQIRDGAFHLTLKETLPLYKESIKEIINIGDKLLSIKKGKRAIKSFSREFLGEERRTLESCWQLYFDRYFRILLMNYKEFYSQIVFKKMLGYDKESRPDFLAVDIYNNIDIIEIKTHRTILFRKEKGRDSYYPSHDLNKSIFQLNKYLDLKSENIHTDKINDEYTKSLIENEKMYRPRGILIISSLDHITSSKTSDEISARLEKEIKKLKTTYNNIDIVLFDELIRNLKNYVQYLDIMLDKSN